MESDQVSQVVVIDPDDLETAREISLQEGVDLEEVPSAGFEPVTTVTLILMGSALAVATVTYLLEKRKGGQIIDLRPGAPQMFVRSKDLIYGLIAIIATDGKVTVEVKEPRGMFGEVLESIQGTLGQMLSMGVEQVGAVVKAVVGDAANVDVKRAEGQA